MKILMVGAGAVGGYFGAHLARAGESVFFMARGAHLEAMKENGLEIRGVEDSFTVSVEAAERPTAEADLIIVAVKAYDNKPAADLFQSAMGEHTAILSVQNGLGNEEYFGERFGNERVLGGVAYVGAEIEKPGVIRQENGGRLILGDFPRGVGDAAEKAGEIFERAKVPCTVTPDIVVHLWEKIIANAVFNTLQTIYRCELREFLEGEKHEEAQRAVDEIVSVTTALDIQLRDHMVKQPWNFCRNSPTFRSSTLQDLERGRPLEIEAFNGAVIGAAKRAGVAVPVHESIYSRLRELSAR